MKKIKLVVPVVAMIALIASCGGGSSAPAPEDGGVSVSTLSDVPDEVLNPQAYDLTTQSASLSAIPNNNRGVGIKAGEGGGGFSRAGCETDTLKKNIIRNAIQPRMILCYVRAFEAASGGVAAGSGEFNYWKMSPPEGSRGPSEAESFEPRVAIKKDGSEFTFVMCNEGEKTMELYIDTSGGIYDGHVIDKWGDNFQGKLEFAADGLPPASFTYATFTQSFVETSDYFSGYGSATLYAAPTYNIVSGFNSGTMPGEGGMFAGATYAKFDADDGTAKYRMDSGSFPGQTVTEAFAMCKASGGCLESGSAAEWVDPEAGWLVNGDPCSLGDITVDDVLCFMQEDCPTLAAVEGLCDIPTGEDYTESFTIDNSNPLSLAFTMADTSTYAVEVAAASAPNSDETPTIEFTAASSGVDCSASDTWTELSFTSEPDMTDCIAMEAELNNWQSGEICANREAQDNAGSVQ